jgi:hypothetical protein
MAGESCRGFLAYDLTPELHYTGCDGSKCEACGGSGYVPAGFDARPWGPAWNARVARIARDRLRAISGRKN